MTRERGHMEKVRDCLRRNSGLLQHLKKKNPDEKGPWGSHSTWAGKVFSWIEVVIVISQGRNDVLVSCWLIVTATARTSAWSLTTGPCSYSSHAWSGSWMVDDAGHIESWSLRPVLVLPESVLNTLSPCTYEAAHLSQGPASLYISRPASVVVWTQRKTTNVTRGLEKTVKLPFTHSPTLWGWDWG